MHGRIMDGIAMGVFGISFLSLGLHRYHACLCAARCYITIDDDGCATSNLFFHILHISDNG